MIRLSVTSRAGRSVFATDRTELLVGSREGADLRIEDPAVAANHCVLRAAGDALVLIDLGGGVHFAGEAVRQAELRPGSAFRLGDVLVEVEAVAGAAPRPKLELEPEPAAAHATGLAGGAPLTPIPHGPHTDFARELKKKLSATPWYAMSLAVHAIILLVLSLIPYESREQYRLQQISAAVGEKSGEIAEARDDLEPDLESLAEKEPEENLEELLEPEKAKTKEEPIPMDVVERPEVVGIGQPRLNKRIKPLRQPASPKLADGEAKLDRSDHTGEQERAKTIASRGLERGIRRLELLPKDKIVVVQGAYDEMQTILELYRIPRTVIAKEHLTTYRLDRAQVLCINCGRSPSPLQKDVLVKKVKKFVDRGGWVITSDWALAPYLTEAFPDYVREVTPSHRQLDTTVEVRPKSANSPLIEGVFARRTRTRWWLEEASKFVGTGGANVRVLIESPDMKRRFGNGAVVIEFRPSRKGRVVHLLGHFYQKDGNRAGVVGMHRLILNFLQERFVGDAGER